jgi:hypothetical protein
MQEFPVAHTDYVKFLVLVLHILGYQFVYRDVCSWFISSGMWVLKFSRIPSSHTGHHSMPKNKLPLLDIELLILMQTFSMEHAHPSYASNTPDVTHMLDQVLEAKNIYAQILHQGAVCL